MLGAVLSVRVLNPVVVVWGCVFVPSLLGLVLGSTVKSVTSANSVSFSNSGANRLVFYRYQRAHLQFFDYSVLLLPPMLVENNISVDVLGYQ